MSAAISQLTHHMLIGFGVLGLAFAVLAVAVCWRALDQYEGRGPIVSRSHPSPTLRGAGHRALRSGGGR